VSPPPARERLPALDVLRGLVMVLMALDHARDFFGDLRLDPLDLDHTTPALFATRIVTHVCAPAFVFLAGASAFLHGRRLSSRAALARYLLTRGLWLIVLELTLVNAAWQLSFTSGFIYVQVIAAIGAGMVGLALLVALPPAVVGLIGVAIVAGHNLFDGVDFPPGTLARDLWTLAHVDREVRLGSLTLVVIYPLLPWLGVMALGYGYGPVLEIERTDRRGIALRRGLLLVILFVALRAILPYGDPHPYAEQETRALSCMAFLNCTKYPPSLQYLAMTLGPVLLGLALFDRPPGWIARRLATFGRVPLFFYVLHILLLAAASLAFYEATLGVPYRALRDFFRYVPAGYGNGLGTVYLAWAGVVLALYPLCAWYGGVRRRSASPLLTYL
jgi:uncharacterized membrane protein